ncbi:hypothetical protein SISNIDRAFT_158844 [Sistotremastrum niveocremeum HHB9708]|uniref:Zn(2)-C6 fungal-type domain-containing protein n=1 Tax=Sistotremastrum niveocremeum HHB9708 TaxID=1314777 RepID=A0A164SSN7_9AGAM|nr:hypothetical protein SISNIDRAFT_158844 [Sistotremastrum niveocremeum HHB9708]
MQLGGNSNDNNDTSPSSSSGSSSQETSVCDDCQRLHRRCEVDSPRGDCKACLEAVSECSFTHGSRAHGSRHAPPEGYLRNMETRLQEMEAALGLIQRIPDQNIQSLLEDIAQDPYAKHILDQVRTSPFIPAGGSQGSTVVDPSSSTSSSGIGRIVDPFVEGPTMQWQEQTISNYMERISMNRTSSNTNQPTHDPLNVPPSDPLSSHTTDNSDSNDPEMPDSEPPPKRKHE